MKEALLTGGRQVEFRDFPVPAPGRDQVLVKIKGASICASDTPASYREHVGHGPEAHQNVSLAKNRAAILRKEERSGASCPPVRLISVQSRSPCTLRQGLVYIPEIALQAPSSETPSQAKPYTVHNYRQFFMLVFSHWKP